MANIHNEAILLANPAMRRTDYQGIHFKHFFLLGKMGNCRFTSLIWTAGLKNASAGLMALLLFSVKQMIYLEKGFEDASFFMTVLKLSVLLLLSEMTLFLAESIEIKHGLAVVETLRHKIFSHLIHLPLPYLQSQPIGEWVARCDYDVRKAQQGLFALPHMFIVFPITFAVYLGSLFFLSVYFAGIIALCSIAGILPAFLLRKRLLTLSRKIIQQIGDLTGKLGETFMHIKTIKSFCVEEKHMQSLSNWSNQFTSIAWKSSLLAISARQISTLMMIFCLIAVSLIGRHMILNGTLTTSELVPIFIGIILLSREARKASAIISSFQDFRSAIQRYLSSLSQPVEQVHANNTIEISGPVQEVIFDHIYFSYSQSDTGLKDIYFHAKRGETLAIVGLSGAGKSTLIDIILGFIKPQQGKIIVNGNPLDIYHLKQWRQRVGSVFQSPSLFRGTVRDNLCLAAQNIKDDEIWSYLSLLELDETVRRRQGLTKALISENASDWSEGESQRMALIRAIISRPDVLLLDEATSALDARSEEAVIKLLQKHSPEMITLVISHRMSLAVKADKVLVLDDERIQGIGSPRQMYDQCPLFRYMCLAQHVTP